MLPAQDEAAERPLPAKFSARPSTRPAQGVDESQARIEEAGEGLDLGGFGGRTAVERVPLAAVARAVAIDHALVGGLEQ